MARALAPGAALTMSLLAAQPSPVTQAEIQQLQDAVFEAGTDLARLRTGDAVLLGQLRPELDDLREEVTYLKVKLRKHEPVSRSEYASVRGRIDEVRRRAVGEETV